MAVGRGLGVVCGESLLLHRKIQVGHQADGADELLRLMSSFS